MKHLIISLILGLFCNQLFAQLDLKRDDFTGTSERGWWKLEHQPNTTIANTQVHNGYISFRLTNPIENLSPPYFCNSAIWDGNPGTGGPYMYVKIKMRIRTTTSAQSGTRGWGLWYTEWNPIDYNQQLWFFESADHSGGTGETWWRALKTNGLSVAGREYSDLAINNQNWHTYEIDREEGYVEMRVDGNEVFSSSNDLPDEYMAFHIWDDNLIYVFNPVGPAIDLDQRVWIGTDRFILDYVQIVPEGTVLDQSETPSGITLLRHVPNDVYGLEVDQQWKDLTFTSPSGGGNFIFLVTGRAEYYTGESSDDIDDDLYFNIDGTSYSKNSSDSFNAADEGTVEKTMAFEQTISSGGIKHFQIYAESSPLLYDATVLGSSTGGVIFNAEYNETKSGGSELWKTINFTTNGGEVAVYVSGTADEDPYPSGYGRYYSSFDNNDDDDMKIVLNSTDYGYFTDESFYGNRLFGDPKSVLIKQTLGAGSHTLRIYGTGSPTLFRVVIYGQNDDSGLPVSLSTFTGNVLANSNRLTWTTESELNNLGFNLYRAESSEKEAIDDLVFEKINHQIIPGAGNSSEKNTYSFLDEEVKANHYYWYQLEDVDYTGLKIQHSIVSLYRDFNIPDDFIVYNNYPNPFNGSTKFKFFLKNESAVQFSIFDTNGQLVEKIGPKTFSEGINFFTWNSKNLSSGIYYCNVSAFQTIQTFKMLLIK